MSYQRCVSEFRPIDLSKMREQGFLEKMLEITKSHVDLVNKKSGWQRIDECPVCKNTSEVVEFEKFGINIVRCNKCSLRYSKKIPLNSADFYSGEEYLHKSIEVYHKNVLYRKERFGKERINLILEHITTREKKLLDVGCGTGWFLDLAREYGFQVFGQEHSKSLSGWTAKQLNIKVFNCSVADIDESCKFDVITMFDVLEHVPDPVHLLIDCKKKLVEKGIIVIFTPNFDSLAINVMKEMSNLISPTDHITYFTKESIHVLAKKVCLAVIHYQTCGIDLGDLKSYFEWKKNEYLSLGCEALYNVIQPTVDRSESGNHLRCILQKI